MVGHIPLEDGIGVRIPVPQPFLFGLEFNSIKTKKMNNKILSIIEARVHQDNWELLQQNYEEVKKENLLSLLLSSHLVQDINEPEIWRIVTIWENLEAMNEYRKSVDVPAWILVFQKVNAVPKLIINTILLSK